MKTIIKLSPFLVLAVLISFSFAMYVGNGKGKIVGLPGLITGEPEWIYHGDDVQFLKDNGTIKLVTFDNYAVGFELDTITVYEVSFSLFGGKKVTSVTKVEVDRTAVPLDEEPPNPTNNTNSTDDGN